MGKYKYVSFDENGVLREREMTCEERVAELTKANQIHTDDVYEAIAIIKDLIAQCNHIVENDSSYDRGVPNTVDAEDFLAKMGGPQR